MSSCLVQKLGNYIPLKQSQTDLLARIEKDTLTLRAGTSIQMGNDRTGELYVVGKGWVLLTQKLQGLDNAITRVYLPGDIIGLDTMSTQGTDETITAAQDAILCPFSKMSLPAIFSEDKQLSILFFFVLGRDSLISRSMSAVVTLLQANERLAYFLLMLRTRLQDLDAIQDEQYTLRMSQIQIGQMISLSQHQVNRSFRFLRESGWIKTDEKNQIKILNVSELSGFCYFSEERFKIKLKEGMI